MKLQEKTSLILVVMLIFILTLISLFVAVVSLSSYNALEHQYVLRDVDQAVSRLNDEYTSLSLITADWGPWDDTYEFVNGNKPAYVSENLLPETFSNLRINLVVMTDSRGRIVYAGAYDLGNRTMVPVPASLADQLTLGNPLLNTADPKSATTGILMLGNEPMIVAARPIIHSDFSGTPQGVIIMGRNLNDDEVAFLAKRAKPVLRFIPVNDPSLPPSLLSSLTTGPDQKHEVIIPLNNNQVAGYTLIRDVYGRDVLIFEILQPRDIYQQGITSTLQFILIVLGAGLLFGVVVLLLLDRLVLSRVSSMSQQVHDIGKQTTFSKRMSVEGFDEFSSLSLEINRMLETIEKTHDGLLQSEARFRELAELLPQIIFEMNMQGDLLFVNHAGVGIFGIDDVKIRRGANVHDYLIPEDFERMHKGLAQIISGAKSTGEIYHLKVSDGTVMSAIVYTAPIHRDDTVTGFRGIVIDITDRVKLEEALIESQEYLQTLLGSVKAGILVADAQTHRIVDANPAALEMIGATKDQLIGQNYRRFISVPEEGDGLITELHGNVDNAERDLLTYKGERISIIKYVVPIMLQGRSCMLETFIDNTARKKVENELRESTELLTGILKASPVGVFRLNASGDVIFVNEMFTRITGLTHEQIWGRYWVGILHPDDQERILGTLEEAIRERKMVKAEMRFIHANGIVYWLLGQTVPIIAPDGYISGWVGTIDDITEQKKMEAALRESQERLSSIFRASPVGVFETQADGTMLYVNQRWEEMVGMTLESMKKSQRTIFNKPLDSTRISKDMWMKFQTRLKPKGELRFMRPDGTIIWIFGQTVPVFDHEGKISGYVGTITDITDRKRDEDAIQLANKKLNLMNDITRHDILNTITGIFGLVDMAVASDNRTELAQLLVQIKDVGRIIQRQITFTRDYQGVGVHAPVWQNIREVISRATQNFIRPGLTIEIEIEDTEVFADPLLEKVFYNLADNALRYGQRVTVIHFYFRVSDQGFELICEDDGVGIPEQEKMRIFEQGVGKNTGMGLFLTREILFITGIIITEDGTPGKGARFGMLIPNGMWRFMKTQPER
jgi:PAS domain S-box-containing protein